MEHSKLVAFSIKCNKCSRMWSISEDDFKKTIIVCQDPECKNEFSVYEGIKNALKSEETIIPNPFLANDMFTSIVDLKIGYSTYFDLPENIKKIYKVNLFPMGPFIAGAVDITHNGFTILSSLPDDGDSSVVGEESKVMVMVHAKTEDYSEPWLHLLSYALDQLRAKEYLVSIMLSEIAFESYVDKTLLSGYINMGMDEASATKFLELSGMHIKVNTLMNNVYQVKLSSSKSWRTWEKKVIKWRNEIAHGVKTSATKEEAKLAYDTVVDSIFYFIEAIDRKKNSYSV
jgi:hypothetical protein